MIIRKYDIFLEARLSDLITSLKGESEIAKQIDDARKRAFDIKAQLPREIKLDYSSVIIRWYNSACHDLVRRIGERTSFVSVDEFVEFLQGLFNQVFPDKIDREVKENGRYTIYSKEYNLSVIIGFDWSKNLKGKYFIDVVTILNGRKGREVVKIIDI